MKKALVALTLLFFLGSCFADGMMVMPPDYTESVFMPEQKAVITWDGSEEELIIESKITTEDISSMAWLIPIESSTKPEVEAADEEIFFLLADLFRPVQKSRGIPFMVGSLGAGDNMVEVIEEIKVDIYDITILKATDSSALINWLNSNGYSFPPGFPNLLDAYTSKGDTYFIANKINLQNKWPGINPTSQDFECAQAIASDPSIRYAFGDGAEAANSVKYMIDDPRCEGASVEPTAALVSLRLGIATPLKISFTPGRPIYPMKLSSLNLGNGKAIVYFVSGKPFKDSTGLFSTKSMLQFQGEYLSEHGIGKGSTITMLEWNGGYSSLEKDSFFEETVFVPELDPNFVPLHETLAEVMLVILLVVFFLALPLGIPLLLVPFVLGMAVFWILGLVKVKKSFFFKKNALAWLVSALITLFGPFFFLLLFALPMLIMKAGLGMDWHMLTSLLSVLGLVFLPYYVSMGCGFLFKRSNYKLRFAIIPIAFLIAYLAFFISFISGSLFGIWPM